ncbi:MAG: sigma-70 family RNA polymerase sigma factor [Bacteroidota bacterium]
MNTVPSPQQARFLVAYRSCHEGFLRYCSALAFERMDVEDLVQDVLLSAYKKFDQLAEPEKLQHYLIRAARNRAISLRRSAARRAALTEVHGERLLVRGATPEQLADVHLLYRAIHRLPAKQRDAILLFEISGFSLREIAASQGTSPAAVKMRLQRGRAKLRQLLGATPGRSDLDRLLLTAKSIAL